MSIESKKRWRTIFLALLLALSGGLLGACNNEGPAEEAGREVDEAMEEAREELEEAGDEIEEATDDDG